MDPLHLNVIKVSKMNSFWSLQGFSFQLKKVKTKIESIFKGRISQKEELVKKDMKKKMLAR